VTDGAPTTGLAYVIKGAAVAEGFSFVTEGAVRTTAGRQASQPEGVDL